MSTHDMMCLIWGKINLTFTPHCHTVREAKGGGVHVPPPPGSAFAFGDGAPLFRFPLSSSLAAEEYMQLLLNKGLIVVEAKCRFPLYMPQPNVSGNCCSVNAL